MMLGENNDIFLSQLISGMLLFKKSISYVELNNAISLFFNICKIDITEKESVYDGVYKYLEDYNKISIKEEYDYETIIYGKVRLWEYLYQNTTPLIIEFLSTHIYQNTKIYISPKDKHKSKIKNLFTNLKRKHQAV